MATVTITNVPEDVVRQLEEDARRNQHTLEDEARMKLGRTSRRSPEEVKRLLEEARKSRESLSAPPLTEEFLQEAKNWGRP